jgi:nucleotide-binding universal stress UspA family protein
MSTNASTVTDPAKAADPFVDPASLGQQLAYAPIVVAVRDGVEGAGPVCVASALERRFGSRVSAIEVLDTSDLALPTPLPAAFTYARELIGDEPYAADARARRSQFSAWLGEPNEWPVRIAVGTVAPEILRFAEHEGAALIVMGLRHHGLVDRVLRDETTLTVARRARAAVLGVTPTLRGLPRNVVVGVDFGPASSRAARAALDIMEPGSETDHSALRLVYVDSTWIEGALEETAGEALIRELGVAAAFERLIRELGVPATIDVHTTVRRGVVAQGILSLADEAGADLIVVGSLRYERLERWILGSVTTEVIRDGRCSVLVIPPTPAVA